MADDDDDLWRRFTKDIRPIKKPAARPTPAKTARKKPPAAKQPAEMIVFSPGLKTQKPALKQPPQLDKRTEDKLRKGKMPIEATLDLHGHTQSEAHDALVGFIKRTQKSGKRCVLVITGKGRKTGEPGILKTKVPLWLNEAPIGPLILKCVSAKPEHGGSGAYYIYLKRDR